MLRLLSALSTAIGVAALMVSTNSTTLANTQNPPPPFSFTAPSPCTGLPVVVTLAAESASEHQSRDKTGRLHYSATLQGTVSSSDGFSGHFATPVTYKESADGRSWSTTTQLNQSLGDGSGQRIVIHSLMQVKVENGTLTFSIEKTHLACVGTPDRT